MQGAKTNESVQCEQIIINLSYLTKSHCEIDQTFDSHLIGKANAGKLKNPQC